MIFQGIEQGVWLTTLFLTLGVSMLKRKDECTVAMLSIIGLTLFTLLFEARARYLYTYAPIFIYLAMLSFHQFYQKITKKLK